MRGDSKPNQVTYENKNRRNFLRFLFFITLCDYFIQLKKKHRLPTCRTAGWFPHRKPNKKEPEGSFLFGTPAGNRTRNGPLGGGCYIHLTTEAYLVIPPGNTSSLRSSCHRKRRGEPGMIFPASMQKHILLSRREYFVAALLVPPQAVGPSSEGGLLKIGNPLNILYFTTFRAKRQLFSRGKFESAPAPPRSRFLSKNVIQTLDNEAGICIIKLDMIQMVCSGSAAAGREGI